jgi:hypothetical protein
MQFHGTPLRLVFYSVYIPATSSHAIILSFEILTLFLETRLLLKHAILPILL